jgi:type I restriction enzyme M protein
VPDRARWDFIKERATSIEPTIGQLLDEAMLLLEAENASLKGVLTKNYARPELDQIRLSEVIKLFSDLAFQDEHHGEDVLGRVYEYFLGQFAIAEGKRGGQFYTAGSVVRVLVKMLQPFQGRVYDPCCGSGGMFVQSERFVEVRLGDGERSTGEVGGMG